MDLKLEGITLKDCEYVNIICLKCDWLVDEGESDHHNNKLYLSSNWNKARKKFRGCLKMRVIIAVINTT